MEAPQIDSSVSCVSTFWICSSLYPRLHPDPCPTLIRNLHTQPILERAVCTLVMKRCCPVTMSQLVIPSVTTSKHVAAHSHHHGVRVPAGLHSTVTTAEPPNISVPSLAGIYWSQSRRARACHRRHISTSTASHLPPLGCVEILRRNHEYRGAKLGSVCASASAGATPGRAQATRQRPLPIYKYTYIYV